ncbi:sensor histidine kinase [Streptomyces sp. NBC_00289]|uniref:sensor histidine kinase n=1 Tax=Streptomyces sp. NBC_00289 TaxID=2975703 RepID=UPI0032542026
MVVSGVRRCLSTLRDDLWTVRADPLPVSLWLRWLPHGLLCLTAFGVALGGAAQLDDGGGLGSGTALLIAGAQGGSVVLALWRPIPAWWLSTAAAVVGAVAVHGRLGAVHGETFPWPWTAAGIVAHLFVLLLVALRVRTRVSVEVLALTALVTYVLEGVWGAGDYDPTGVIAVCLSAVVVVLGIALHGRREARTRLVEQETITAEERARRTLLEERSRIARELHDVVAHHMSVISIQAQVAPHLTENPSEELKENLAGIRQNAVEALAELRRVLGVLRSENPDDPYGLGGPGTGAAPDAPQPTLDRLDALIENTRAAGLTVTTGIEGDAPSYPPGLELSAYRIIQEALSNALRHAPGSTVRVDIHHFPRGLYLSVINSRPQYPVPRSPGAGHGLLGMRERAAMLGGHVTANETLHGGFAISAYLPRDGNADTEPETPDVPGTPAVSRTSDTSYTSAASVDFVDPDASAGPLTGETS